MAVYQGTRPQVLIPGGGRATAPAATRVRAPSARRAAAPVERRSRRRTLRAQRQVRPVAMVMAIIISGFVLGLIHLTQTLQAGAVEHELVRLQAERLQLERDIQTLGGTVIRWGSEPQVVDWAQQNGLDRLGGTIRVPAP